MLDGKPSEQKVVNQAEDGRVGANPQRQTKDNHRSVGWILGQHTNAIPQVLDQGSHLMNLLQLNRTFGSGHSKLYSAVDLGHQTKLPGRMSCNSCADPDRSVMLLIIITLSRVN